MNGEPDLPDEVGRQIDQSIDSLECLKSCCSSIRDAVRAWTVEQIRLAAFLVIIAAILDGNRKPR